RPALLPVEALDGALGPFRQAAASAALWRRRLSQCVVVGRSTRCEARIGAVIRPRAGSCRPGGLTRRDALAAATGMLAAALPRVAAGSPETGEVESHGLSAFGDLKYPADFRHFDYADPQAVKGGAFSQVGSVRYYNQNFLTFNSLNGFILRGDAALGIERT